MARQRAPEGGVTRRPATSPEGRELELQSMAYDLVEERLRNGSASSQETTFFLKAGSSRERLEQERMRHEIELMEVKRENLEAQTRVEELYLNALDAMRGYSGLPAEGETVDGTYVED